MKQAILVAIIAGAAVASGCGGTYENRSNTANTTGPAATNTEQSPVSVAGTSNQTVADEMPQANTGDTAANRYGKRPIVDNPASGPAPRLQYRPAGDDSEIAVTMKSDGKVYEYRVFKSHPQLARVESVWAGSGPKELKFVLRNGRVVTKTSDRIANLQTATAAVLVEIAGIPPEQPTAPSATSKVPVQKRP